jgi:hypothetical protein
LHYATGDEEAGNASISFLDFFLHILFSWWFTGDDSMSEQYYFAILINAWGEEVSLTNRLLLSHPSPFSSFSTSLLRGRGEGISSSSYLYPYL